MVCPQWCRVRSGARPGQLLAREKEATRQRDALNADRRRLPMVRIDAEYVFEGPQGARPPWPTCSATAWS